jgi:hypothetical protein
MMDSVSTSCSAVEVEDTIMVVSKGLLNRGFIYLRHSCGEGVVARLKGKGGGGK